MKRLKPAIALASLSSLLLLTGAGCADTQKEVAPERISLEIWRVFDNDDTFDEIVRAYRAMHPNVTINYQEKRFSEYEDELIRALAEGRGPDIFSVHNTKMRELQDLIAPMPNSTIVTEQRAAGGIGNNVITVEVENLMPTQRNIRQNFVAQVAEDVILPYQADPKLELTDRIFGLPMSMDNMALFYNQDLLDAAGIASPPSTWEEFQSSVIALTSYNDVGDIIQSGAAIGTADNVERSTDLLSLLMMQNNTEMVDDRGRISFHLIPSSSTDKVSPGLLATDFYTDFADPTKEVFTWDDTFSSSFEAFANGQTAMFFGYSYHLPILRTTAPKLNIQTAEIPQISPDSQQVNFANYWIESVSNQSAETDWAWDFVNFATSEAHVTSYLDSAQKSTALRSLLPYQIDDENIGVFARQALTSKSWYAGKDIATTEKAMRDLITNILSMPEDPLDVITNAAKKVAQTM